jgi:glucose-1-phosphate cytidylyltransferase
LKAVILAGGLGTRISEESYLKPKPMIEVGGRPILWHIMKGYSIHGITEFVICCGYKGYMIKEYFSNYFLHRSDVTVDLENNTTTFHRKNAEPWKVSLIDTGLDSQTGGRIKRIQDYVDGPFCLTYGDGVCNVDVKQVIDFHKKQGTIATVTAIQPAGRFGALTIDGPKVSGFEEKIRGDGKWVNGGFFVCNQEIFDHLEGDSTIFERDPLKNLAEMGELSVWQHDGFWAAMDTMRDRTTLEELWASGDAPWKTW